MFLKNSILFNNSSVRGSNYKFGNASSKKYVSKIYNTQNIFNLTDSTAINSYSITTVFPNWPDAIKCRDNAYYDNIFILRGPTSLIPYNSYYQIIGSESRYVTFNHDGTYLKRGGDDSASIGCKDKSISELYASDSAYNLVYEPAKGHSPKVSMVENWPDAIKCYNSLFLIHYSGTVSGPLTWYCQLGQPRFVRFNPNGTIYTDQPDSSACLGTTIADLYNSGNAFNLVSSKTQDPTGAGTMIANWPDAIKCNGHIFFIHAASSLTGYITWYYQVAADNRYINFNSGGSYNSRGGDYGGATEGCEGKSIADLYNSGNAFNYLSGNPVKEINLVTNPGAETGDMSGWSVSSGWSIGKCSDLVSRGYDYKYFHSEWFFFNPTSGSMTQDLSFVIGSSCTASFWVQGDSSNCSLTLAVGETTLLSLNDPANGWRFYRSDFTATKVTEILNITAVVPHPEHSIWIDDISVTCNSDFLPTVSPISYPTLMPTVQTTELPIAPLDPSAVTSMIPNWPDAIKCEANIFFLENIMISTVKYNQFFSTRNNYVVFNINGTFNSRGDEDGSSINCEARSITTLYNSKHGFNLVSSIIPDSSGTTSIFPNWPDAIRCDGNFYFINRVEDGAWYGRAHDNKQGYLFFHFNEPYLGNIGGNCQGKSISDLYHLREAFNLVASKSQDSTVAKTMIKNWPDAIKCDDMVYFVHSGRSNDGETSWYFNSNANPNENRYINFKANGTYNSRAYNEEIGEACAGKSIADLYSSGNAFNFLAAEPTQGPTEQPTKTPINLSTAPTSVPTSLLTFSPTANPTSLPTPDPTLSPTALVLPVPSILSNVLEARVNSDFIKNNSHSSICRLAADSILVVWQGQDSDGFGIWAKVCDNNNACHDEFQVNSFAAGDQTNPVATSLSNGECLITWASERKNIFATKFNPKTVKVGNEFPIKKNIETCEDESLLITATGLNKDQYLISWSGIGGEGNNEDCSVFMKFYNEKDVQNWSSELSGADSYHHPYITKLSNGGFAITYIKMLGKTCIATVNAKIYNMHNNRLSDELVELELAEIFGENECGDRIGSASAISRNGEITFYWENKDTNGESHIFGKTYSISGEELKSLFQVSPTQPGYHNINPSSVTLEKGDTDVVVWSQYKASDGVSTGIYAQQYSNLSEKSGQLLKLNHYFTGDSFSFNNYNNPSITSLSCGAVTTWTGWTNTSDSHDIYFAKLDTCKEVERHPSNWLPTIELIAGGTLFLGAVAICIKTPACYVYVEGIANQIWHLVYGNPIPPLADQARGQGEGVALLNYGAAEVIGAIREDFVDVER